MVKHGKNVLKNGQYYTIFLCGLHCLSALRAQRTKLSRPKGLKAGPSKVRLGVSPVVRPVIRPVVRPVVRQGSICGSVWPSVRPLGRPSSHLVEVGALRLLVSHECHP